MKREFTEEEIRTNNYLLHEFKTKTSLAQHIKNMLDIKGFAKPDHIIDSIMDPLDPKSLISFLIEYERYEDCAWLRDEYEKLIIKPDQHSQSVDIGK